MALNNERGQTMVEYILLMAVAVSLVMTFYNSDAFKRLFGSQGSLGTKIKGESEFSYRHAFMRNMPADVPRGSREGAVHPSYFDTSNSGTHFFGAKNTYP